MTAKPSTWDRPVLAPLLPGLLPLGSRPAPDLRPLIPDSASPRSLAASPPLTLLPAFTAAHSTTSLVSLSRPAPPTSLSQEAKEVVLGHGGWPPVGGDIPETGKGWKGVSPRWQGHRANVAARVEGTEGEQKSRGPRQLCRAGAWWHFLSGGHSIRASDL